jgi:AcrR family transcriptional regulator
MVDPAGVSSATGAPGPPGADSTAGTRAYNSASRRAQSAETRERIIGAAKKLLRKSSVRDWHSLTIRAVAQEAGVNERTVYRHFTDERGLRDAVMRDLERSAGIDLSDLELADIAGVAARIFDHVASYTFEKRPLDPTMTEALLRQREALHDALEPWTTDWPAPASAAVAGLFDVLWSVGSFERLTVDWTLSAVEARDALTWLIRLVEEAVRSGRRPPW